MCVRARVYGVRAFVHVCLCMYQVCGYYVCYVCVCVLCECVYV